MGFLTPHSTVASWVSLVLTLYPPRNIRSADRPRARTSRPPPLVPPEGFYGGSRGCSWTATAPPRWPGLKSPKSDTYFATFARWTADRRGAREKHSQTVNLDLSSSARGPARAVASVRLPEGAQPAAACLDEVFASSLRLPPTSTRKVAASSGCLPSGSFRPRALCASGRRGR